MHEFQFQFIYLPQKSIQPLNIFIYKIDKLLSRVKIDVNHTSSCPNLRL